jgi:hypothetical protein
MDDDKIITWGIKGMIWLLILSVMLNCRWYYALHKAEICNKAFVLWFHHNQGVDIDLNYFYQDAVKWVNDPQYQ